MKYTLPEGPETWQTLLLRIKKRLTVANSSVRPHRTSKQGADWEAPSYPLTPCKLQGGPGVSQCEGSYQQGGSKNNYRDVLFDYRKDSKGCGAGQCSYTQRKWHVLFSWRIILNTSDCKQTKPPPKGLISKLLRIFHQHFAQFTYYLKRRLSVI